MAQEAPFSQGEGGGEVSRLLEAHGLHCYPEEQTSFINTINSLISTNSNYRKITGCIKCSYSIIISLVYGSSNLFRFSSCHPKIAAEMELSREIFVDRPESYSATHSKNCIFMAHKKLRMVWT